MCKRSLEFECLGNHFTFWVQLHSKKGRIETRASVYSLQSADSNWNNGHCDTSSVYYRVVYYRDTAETKILQLRDCPSARCHLGCLIVSSTSRFSFLRVCLSPFPRLSLMCVYLGAYRICHRPSRWVEITLQKRKSIRAIIETRTVYRTQLGILVESRNCYALVDRYTTTEIIAVMRFRVQTTYEQNYCFKHVWSRYLMITITYTIFCI